MKEKNQKYRGLPDQIETFKGCHIFSKFVNFPVFTALYFPIWYIPFKVSWKLSNIGILFSCFNLYKYFTIINQNQHQIHKRLTSYQNF